MNTLFKFNLILVINLSLLLITNVLGSSSLNPCAKPYSPPKKDCAISMVKATRRGDTVWAPEKTLILMEESCYEVPKTHPSKILDMYFWTAVHNCYHKATYKIAGVLFARILPQSAKTFPILSNRPEDEVIDILSHFYSLMATIDCDHFSPEDRQRFKLHATKLKPHW